MKLFILLLSLGLTLGVGLAGLSVIVGQISLFLTPLPWVWEWIWVGLYILTGTAFYKVLVRREKFIIKRPAIIIYLVQLGLNLLWPVLLNQPNWLFAAVMGAALLWITIYMTIVEFKKISSAAAMLLVPYWLWTGLASYLTFSVWNLRPVG